VGDNPGDANAVRRTELEAQFHALPSAGTTNYWRIIEDSDTQQAIPLEVLARCFRERNGVGSRADAERVFNVICRLIQPRVRHWAGWIANQARSGMKPQLQEDLEQECYLKLWEELASDGPTFLLEHFPFALNRLHQHIAHDVMERIGEWQRREVGTPMRIPNHHIESLQKEPEYEGDVSLAVQISDPSAQDAFDQADLSDLLDLVHTLPIEQRVIILDHFWDGRTQAETAAKLGISDRMVRYRLKTILRDLGVRYRHGEEDNRA